MRILSFSNLKIYGALLIAQIVMLTLPSSRTGISLPNIVVMLVFFFSIIEETCPSYFFLILLGMIIDAYSGSIIGGSSLGYVLVSLVASSNQKALNGQKFNIVWLAFVLALTIFETTRCLIVMFFKYIPNLQILIVSYFLNIVFYPIMHNIIARKHQWLRINA